MTRIENHDLNGYVENKESINSNIVTWNVYHDINHGTLVGTINFCKKIKSNGEVEINIVESFVLAGYNDLQAYMKQKLIDDIYSYHCTGNIV